MNIGAASNASGVSQRMIRHYEKIGLVPAPARRGNYRDYSDADVHRLRFIANARDLGFPIEDIRALLGLWSDRERSSGEVKALAEARAAELGRKAHALEEMRRILTELARACHGDKRPDCPIIQRLEADSAGKLSPASPRPPSREELVDALDDALIKTVSASDPAALTAP